MTNTLKTTLLLGALSALLLFIGEVLGGAQGLLIAFLFAAGTNFVSYFYSDKIVLRMYRAQEVGAGHPLYATVARLAQTRGPADAQGVHHPGQLARTRLPPGATRSMRRWLPPRASCERSVRKNSMA